jgi:diguanylate cyclase (GGDEF)-like protein
MGHRPRWPGSWPQISPPERLARLLPERLRPREERSALRFGVRMVLAVAVTFLLIGVSGYLALEHELANRQIADFASSQRADARSFEAYAAHAPSRAVAITNIERLLDAVASRPGTLEATLITRHNVIVASANDATVGTLDSDRPIDATLARGLNYAGREKDPKADRRDFEFVVPINVGGTRYAYAVIYDHRAYDAQLARVRTIVAVIALLSLLGGGVVFYLVGGRRLMRDHRTVLRRATRDGLTDLPNTRAFQDEFPQAVASSIRYSDALALALLDVDDFKLINDRHGHQQGDAVLKRVAEILREARPGDRSYRIGGDEFAVLLAHTDAQGARVLAERLSRRLSDAGIEVSVGVSCLRPGLQADTLRAEADSALYEAKRQGGARAAHFDDIRDRVVVTTAERRETVRRLIEEQRFTIVFQPIWDLEREALLGLEALMRPDPSYGLSGPAEAFDLAEQIGRVRQLDVLCIEEALRCVPAIGPDVLLFLNLSPLTLDLDAEADAWLQPLVERAGLRPESIVIEVTERFGARTEAVVKRLRRLREQGFQTALDDVGTGNSGLEMLRKIDAEFVKLDRSVVTAASTEPGARAVLMAMATFARQTGAFVIAEGIEDGETLAFLRSLDERHLAAERIVRGGQGFGLGRPSRELEPQAPAMLHDSRPSVPPNEGERPAGPLSAAASAARRRAGSSRR